MTNDEYMALNRRVWMTQGHIEKLIYDRDHIIKDPSTIEQANLYINMMRRQVRTWRTLLIPGGAQAM